MNQIKYTQETGIKSFNQYCKGKEKSDTENRKTQERQEERDKITHSYIL